MAAASGISDIFPREADTTPNGGRMTDDGDLEINRSTNRSANINQPASPVKTTPPAERHVRLGLELHQPDDTTFSPPAK